MSANGHRYNVGGVMLERPFKIRRLGHFGFNVNKVEECREFYGDILGFTQSDKADFSRAPWFPKGQDLGPQGYFMRYGTDHHAMVLFSKQVMDLRADRKFAPGVTINQITWQCGSGWGPGNASPARLGSSTASRTRASNRCISRSCSARDGPMRWAMPMTGYTSAATRISAAEA